jgi:very-short-patch-repair endonuclease
MGRKVARADVLIAKIAGRQHGVVAVGQLYGLGLGERAVRGRVDAGRLHRVHRGVYAVGHSSLSLEGQLLAAVLAVGRVPSGEDGDLVLDFWGAAVSHRSAAFLWNLLPRANRPSDVIVMGNGGRAKRSGFRIHRSLTLVSSDVTLLRGIPVTTPARTISDLRLATGKGWPGAVPPRELRKAIRQANVLGLPIGEGSGMDRTRSDLERDFLRLCRRHRLPRPEVNVRVGPHLVDFLWRERRLVVETDGYRYHRGRAAFQDDRGRDLQLRRLGYEVLRLSERQLEEPALVAKTLIVALKSRKD